MVCMSAGFAMMIPSSWMDIAQSSQTRGRALVHTTRHYFSTTQAVNSVTCHDPGAYTRMDKATLDVFLSKAQLSEQSASLGRPCCRSPDHQTSHIHMQDDEKRYAYSCCVTHARKMHGCRATASDPTGTSAIFRELISYCRHESSTRLGQIVYATHFFELVSQNTSRPVSALSQTLKIDIHNARRMPF
jgi:hypothetical protein